MQFQDLPPIREMNRDQLLLAQKELEKQIDLEWKSWQRCSKESLLAEISRTHRIHCLSAHNAKWELLRVIVSAKFGSTTDLIEKRLGLLADEEGKRNY